MLRDGTDRAWFSRLVGHPARKRSRSILTTPEPARGCTTMSEDCSKKNEDYDNEEKCLSLVICLSAFLSTVKYRGSPARHICLISPTPIVLLCLHCRQTTPTHFALLTVLAYSTIYGTLMLRHSESWLVQIFWFDVYFSVFDCAFSICLI